MSGNDYGKLAYLQVQELKKTVSAVSKNRARQRTVIKKKQGVTLNGTVNCISYALNASKTDYAEVEFTAVYCSATAQNVEVTLNIDGVVASEQTVNMGAGVVGVINNVFYGEIQPLCEVEICFGVTGEVEISSCYLVVRGESLSDSAENSILLACEKDGNCTYGIIAGQTLSLYSDLSGNPTEIEVGAVDKGEIFYYGSDLLLLTTLRGKLRIAKIIGGQIGSVTQLAGSVSAFCVGSVGASTVIFYAVRQKIYAVTLTSEVAISSAVEILSAVNQIVSLQLAVSGENYLVVSGSNKSKIYVSSGGEFSLTLSENYGNCVGVEYDGGIVCYYLDSGKVVKTFEGEQGRTAVALCYADNAVSAGQNCLVYVDGKLKLA